MLMLDASSLWQIESAHELVYGDFNGLGLAQRRSEIGIASVSEIRCKLRPRLR